MKKIAVVLFLPLRQGTDMRMISRGGYYSDFPLSLDKRSRDMPYTRLDDMGFRLVVTSKEVR